jgi:hypothetical protein
MRHETGAVPVRAIPPSGVGIDILLQTSRNDLGANKGPKIHLVNAARVVEVVHKGLDLEESPIGASDVLLAAPKEEPLSRIAARSIKTFDEMHDCGRTRKGPFLSPHPLATLSRHIAPTLISLAVVVNVDPKRAIVILSLGLSFVTLDGRCSTDLPCAINGMKVDSCRLPANAATPSCRPFWANPRRGSIKIRRQLPKLEQLAMQSFACCVKMDGLASDNEASRTEGDLLPEVVLAVSP